MAHAKTEDNRVTNFPFRNATFAPNSEANQRYEWNARGAGGVHEGMEEGADKLMADNGVIRLLERARREQPLRWTH